MIGFNNEVMISHDHMINLVIFLKQILYTREWTFCLPEWTNAKAENDSKISLLKQAVKRFYILVT